MSELEKARELQMNMELEEDREMQQNSCNQMTEDQVQMITQDGSPHLPPSLPCLQKSLMSKLQPLEKVQGHPMEALKNPNAEKESPLQQLKRQAQQDKALKAKENWIQNHLKKPKLDALNSTCQIQTMKQQSPQKLSQNPLHKSTTQAMMNQSPSHNCVMPSNPYQAVNTGYVSPKMPNAQDGKTLQEKVKQTNTFTQRTINYSDDRFDKLKSDIRETLNNDQLYTTTDCLQYIKRNTTFNGEANICIDLIKFVVVNRHARFIEVFASFMHILDLCKEEDMNNTLDNLIAVALANKPVAIILLTILGTNTFEQLLHINRDIGDSTKILSEISTTCEIDEMFET